MLVGREEAHGAIASMICSQVGDLLEVTLYTL